MHPQKLGKRNRLKYQVAKEYAQYSKKTYTEIVHIKNAVDKDVKGNFSEAIQKGIAQENRKLERII